MYILDGLELSATLTEKDPLPARAQSRIEESIMMAMNLSNTERKSQMAIGTASLFIYRGAPLNFI